MDIGWTLRPQPNLCVTLTGLQIYAISPRAAPGLTARRSPGLLCVALWAFAALRLLWTEVDWVDVVDGG